MMWFTVSGAEPGERVYLAFGTEGLGAGPCPDRLEGACLDVVGGRILRSAVTDEAGMATLLGTPSEVVAPGTPTAFQAVRARPGDVVLSRAVAIESEVGTELIAHTPRVEIVDDNGNGLLDAGESFHLSAQMTSHGLEHMDYPMLQLMTDSPVATVDGKGSYVWFGISPGTTYTGWFTVHTDPSAGPGPVDLAVAVTELHCEVGECIDPNAVSFTVWLH
jgi:hypothetical protein